MFKNVHRLSEKKTCLLMPIKFLKSVFVFSNIQQNKAMQVTDDKHCTYSSTHCLLLTGNAMFSVIAVKFKSVNNQLHKSIIYPR